MTIMVLLELVVSLSTEAERLFGIEASDFRRVARTLVRTTTMSRLGKVTGYLVRRRTEKTDIPVVAAQSKLMRMSWRNTGQKPGSSQKGQAKGLPDQADTGDG